MSRFLGHTQHLTITRTMSTSPGSSALTGNWSTVRHKLQHAAKTCHKQLQQAVLREATHLASNIQINITEAGRWAKKPFAPNAASTIKRKKSSAPLINHGDLRNSITVRQLNNPTTILVGIPGDASRQHRPMGDCIAAYARIHEFGATYTDQNGNTRNIPQRSFIWSVVEHTRTTRRKQWQADLKRLLQPKASPP